MTRHIIQYAIEVIGIEHAEDAREHAPSSARWDEVYEGHGTSPHMAVEDALKMAAGAGWVVDVVENTFDPLQGSGDVVHSVELSLRAAEGFEPRQGDIIRLKDGRERSVQSSGQSGMKGGNPYWFVEDPEGATYIVHTPDVEVDREEILWTGVPYDLERTMRVSAYFENKRRLAKSDLTPNYYQSIDMIRDLIAEFDLQAYASVIEAAALPSIRLQSRKIPKNARRPGLNRLGGLPDLPAGVAWPTRNGRPLSFLAQLRLSGLTAYDSVGLLPRVGVLYFFYDAEEQPWGTDPSDHDGWQVIFWPDEAAPLAQASPPPGLAITFPPRALRPMFEWTLPSWEHSSIRDLGFSDNEDELYTRLANSLYIGAGSALAHRMLGNADAIQGEMEFFTPPQSEGSNQSATPVTTGDNWHLLLQIATDDDAEMRWGDEGNLYFWIEDAALKARQFDNVRLVLQCY